MRKLGILFPINNEYTRVGGFTVDGTGRAVLDIVVPEYQRQLEDIAAGVGSHSLERKVDPSEGEVFLDAVAEQCERSSYWRVIDES